MTTLVCFVQDYLNYYLNKFSSVTILSTGNTLQDEYENYLKYFSALETPPKTPQELEQHREIRKTKKKLEGDINISSAPFVLQQELIRSKLNIPPHIWDKYSNSLKAKTLAVEIIKSQIEQLDDFHRELKSNKKS